MNLPRILLTTYPEAFLFRAGGEFELITLADSLKKHGFIADLYGAYSRNLDCYDLVIHFSLNPNGLSLVKEMKQYGKKIILWPNFWAADTVDTNGTIFGEFYNLADKILFKSQTEIDHLNSICSIPIDKIVLIPTIVDECFEKRIDEPLFSTLYGIKNYGIWFGVIEPHKNQLTAIKALRELDCTMVFVGAHRNDDYYNECIKEASDKMHFIESLPYRSDITLSALQHADFYLEIPFEPSGISALSAGIAGCQMILSDDQWNHEHFDDSVIFVDSHSVESVQQGVKCALSTPEQSHVALSLEKYLYTNSTQYLIKFLMGMSR